MGLGYLNEYNLQELTKLLAKLLLDDGPGATWWLIMVIISQYANKMASILITISKLEDSID